MLNIKNITLHDIITGGGSGHIRLNDPLSIVHVHDTKTVGASGIPIEAGSEDLYLTIRFKLDVGHISHALPDS
jgi:hypothetical protein